MSLRIHSLMQNTDYGDAVAGCVVVDCMIFEHNAPITLADVITWCAEPWAVDEQTKRFDDVVDVPVSLRDAPSFQRIAPDILDIALRFRS